MISIITKIPVKQAIKIVRDITYNETTKLVKVFLNSTYFSFRGKIYEQIEGIAMGSPLSPIVAKIYIDFFEKEALQSFPLQSKWWIRYVDDTNINWSHGRENLIKFLNHLNSRSDHIKFTMEVDLRKRPFHLQTSSLGKTLMDNQVTRHIEKRHIQRYTSMHTPTNTQPINSG